MNQVVNPPPTTTALASSLNPSVLGQPVTLTATVTAVAPGAGTPAGTVTFYDGATVLGTGTLDAAGVATLTTSALGVGDPPDHRALRGHLVLRHLDLGAAGPAGRRRLDRHRADEQRRTRRCSGQAVTLTATVTAVAPGAGTPAGTVTFKDGATVLGTGTLDGSRRGDAGHQRPRGGRPTP